MLSERSRNEWIRKVKYGMSLEFASLSAKEDREVVLAAVRANGLNLEYASWQLRKDPMIVKTAIMQNDKAIDFVNGDLRKQIIMSGVNSLGDLEEDKTDDLNYILNLVLSCENDDELNDFIDAFSNYGPVEAERKVLSNKIMKLLDEQVEIVREIDITRQRLLDISSNGERLSVFPVDENGKIVMESVKKKVLK